ncbi:MAG: type I methionyl aminopeptidase [Candidatus Harrisonbacteria bacterium]|nr:type I methionyl aminopeptidase [Candidatus Harrisonbacteria bacterium]
MSVIKTPEEIEKIRTAGRILSKVAKVILLRAEAGVTLRSLDNLAKKLILEAGGKPAFLGYKPYGAKRPYPCSICTSVNDVVVHGVPGDYRLKNGDLLKLDFGVIYDGFYADAAWTKGIGRISPEAQKLVKTTEKALFAGINEALEGNRLGDIGYAVNRATEKGGFAIVKGLTGHGIGSQLHEEPSVYNEGKRGTGEALEVGMVLAIEPMVSAGSPNIVQRKDDSFATADGSLSAHFEHTVAILETGPEVLTLI